MCIVFAVDCFYIRASELISDKHKISDCRLMLVVQLVVGFGPPNPVFTALRAITPLLSELYLNRNFVCV